MKSTLFCLWLLLAIAYIAIILYQQNNEIHTLKWRVINLEEALRN